MLSEFQMHLIKYITIFGMIGSFCALMGYILNRIDKPKTKKNVYAEKNEIISKTEQITALFNKELHHV